MKLPNGMFTTSVGVDVDIDYLVYDLTKAINAIYIEPRIIRINRTKCGYRIMGFWNKVFSTE